MDMSRENEIDQITLPASLKHGKNPSNSTLESLTHTLYIAHGLQMTDWHLLEIDQLRINCRYSIHGLDSIPNRTGTHTLTTQ